jgi:hypothetical protein
MLQSNFPADILRRQDLIKVDVQFRDSKDLFITCPPLSGLSSFLKQIQKHVHVSEHFRDFRLIFFDCQSQNSSSNNIIGQIMHFTLSELSMDFPKRPNQRQSKLNVFFESVVKANEQEKLVFIIDNLEKAQRKETIRLLENIRVLAEARPKSPYLRNVVFVLAGHGLDLRKLDPKHSSPFNTATQIYLDDLDLDDSLSLIRAYLSDKKHSTLVPEYIDFLTFGHPYLIKQICYHILNDEVKVDNTKGVNFEVVDSVVNMIGDDKRDRAIRQIDDTLQLLSSNSVELLRKILNGYMYKSVKSSELLRELKLYGIINNNRINKWHVRNSIFDTHIRNLPAWSNTVRSTNFIPRRLFVNSEGYKTLFELENNLREFVVAKLFDAFGEDWERIIKRNETLKSTIKQWGNMKTAEQKLGWLSHEDLPSLSYSLFPEIKDLIYEYWGGFFEKYFHPKNIFEGSFESLESLRNKIAHNRPLSDQDVETLASIAKQFNDCMIESNLQ